MGSNVQIFSLDLLNDYFGLNRFLSGEAEVELVKQQPPAEKGLYFNRWHVVLITVTYPFAYIISLVLSALSSILYALGHQPGYHFFAILSEQILRPSEQLAVQQRFGERLLVPTINVHKIGNYELYRQPVLPIDFITDPKVKQFTFLEGHKRNNDSLKNPDLYFIDLAKLTGMCKGAALWIIHLFLKTKNDFSDPKEHLIALARLFTDGMPPQAAILQVLDGNIDKPISEQRINSLKFTNDKKGSLEKIGALSPGAYMVALNKHAIAYFKFSDEHAFYWDPAIQGLIDISGKTQAEMLYNHIVERHEDRTYDIYFWGYELGKEEGEAEEVHV